MAIPLISWYQKVMGNEKQRLIYAKYASITLGVALATTGLFFGYRWYSVYRARQAQALLADYMHTAQTSPNMLLTQLEELFQSGADKERGSQFESYFLAQQANVLIKENKLDEAIGVMEKAIASMSRDNLLRPLFAAKYALMQLDSADAAVKEAGLQKLTELAQDKQNQYADMASFFLGNYYWSNDKLDDAKKVWQELIESQRKDQMVALSPWAQLAHVKLQQIMA